MMRLETVQDRVRYAMVFLKPITAEDARRYEKIGRKYLKKRNKRK